MTDAKDFAAPCSTCKVPAGKPCVNKHGKPMAALYRHRARLRAVAAVRWNLVERGATLAGDGA